MKKLKLCLITASIMTSSAHAGDLSVTLGGVYNSANSNASLGIPILGAKLKVDAESHLDLAEKNLSPYVKIEYNFDSGNSVYMDWRSLHRHARTSVSSDPIKILGSEFKADATLDLNLDIDIARIGYAHRIISTDNFDLDAMLGLHLIQLSGKGGISANINEGGQDWLSFNTKGKKNSLAPMPNMGVRGSYRLTQNLGLASHLEAFMLSTRLFDGHLIDFNFGAYYQITDSLILNASYNHYEIGVEYGDSLLNANMGVDFSGPMLALQYKF
ncbi:hypothetical protein JCM19241_4896 [Vibrio ishigakensis]|uniref:Outer membrane protein beta-barrel domain-containing protein n=1 Tax=Vibrio ishigakensis TaxID=1481914 RepID=A0A0B8QHY9_9VIBR|nr:hypothetical protein JCM19241_4896 [Vibrio ishigakensis]